MVQTVKSTETYQSLKMKMITIYEYFVQQQDHENADKVKQLAKKLENREFMIAFCGHFSAGKSSMINQVIGENLLPSSPIPTSANLVKVKTGEEYAKVYFKYEKPRMYLAPYDYELVKNFCKDGDQIEEIEISHTNSPLPKNAVIMDTPGIDSADDAHRIATESAMHLADIIFYVMDYNHVQAELNFLFTKELTKAGKDVYLVINQIDKHNDEEISFQEFQKSVVNSFASWGVNPARIFYTTLRQPNLTFNEFEELHQFISKSLMLKDKILIPSIFHSLKKIANDHLLYARLRDEEILQPKVEILNELSELEKQNVTETFHQIGHSLLGMKNKVADAEKKYDEMAVQIMKNAYLMPFSTRELAKEYLEACQSEFKVGFLFSKQKTEAERNNRLENFYQDIHEKVKSQLEWHLREFLLSTIKENGLDDGEAIAKAQSFNIEVPKDLLVKVVKTSARVSGEYILHYTEDVAAEIKKMARTRLDSFKEFFLTVLTDKTKKLKEQYEKEYSTTEKYVHAIEELMDFKEKNRGKENKIESMLVDDSYKEDTNRLFIHEEEEFEVVKSSMVDIGQMEGSHETEKITELPKLQSDKSLEVNSGLTQIVEQLQKTSCLIKGLPGFQRIAEELEGKAERLAHKGFTISLFGAFSAGKSSFANALMGEKVLPVSPNPTTAAINKIKPVSPETPHGTVLVKFKDPSVMLEDINRSLKIFELQAANFTDASQKIQQINFRLEYEDVLEKTHFSFLTAFQKGTDAFVKLLGTTLRTDLAEFHDFVAMEEKSCFVEWIELYYDCELTRKGITLVDTPGADSINARHTGVAFDYIKNSDAILFVTYYNHAFSKADREFLIQLGRVKDSFQLDKMFFIINAIDLAENEEEKETVARYVKDQLVKYGIRKPHLFPLSSLLAIQEKHAREPKLPSGMKEFEQEFYHFISSDLTEMIVSSAAMELVRVQELVEKLIVGSMADQTDKEKKQKEIGMQKTAMNELLITQKVDQIQHRLLQELEELVYYIKQRVFLRFNEFFKEAFNPSTLRDDGQNLKKSLQGALDEFLESIGFDFAQEMRATTVRLDRFTEKVFADYRLALIRNLQEINKDISFSVFDVELEGEIDFPIAFKDIERHMFTKGLSYFKNPKTFFEKNEKKFMSEELERVLNPESDVYLKEESMRLAQHFGSMLSIEFTRMVNHFSEEKDDYYFSFLSTLDGGVSLEHLIEIQNQLKQV